MVFILTEAWSFPRKLGAVLASPERDLPHFKRFAEKLNRYFAIKTTVSVGTGIFVGLALWLLGVDFPVLWGMLAFLLNYVPNIGSVLAAVPPVLLAAIQLGPLKAVATACVFLVVNVVMGSVVEPKFMGRELGLSTLVVFLSLVFWGWMLGPVGMLLSVPLTMTVKIALEANPSTDWLAHLLDPADHRRVGAKGGRLRRRMSSYERDNVRRMAGYVYGEQPEDPDVVKLNTNENPYPPSPAVGCGVAPLRRRQPAPLSTRDGRTAASPGRRPARRVGGAGGRHQRWRRGAAARHHDLRGPGRDLRDHRTRLFVWPRAGQCPGLRRTGGRP